MAEPCPFIILTIFEDFNDATERFNFKLTLKVICVFLVLFAKWKIEGIPEGVGYEDFHIVRNLYSVGIQVNDNLIRKVNMIQILFMDSN